MNITHFVMMPARSVRPEVKPWPVFGTVSNGQFVAETGLKFNLNLARELIELFEFESAK